MADDVIRIVAAALVLTCAASARADDWTAQLSSRLYLGGGVHVPEQAADPWPLFELGLRSEVLFGEARPAVVRIGPAVDLRTEDFQTFEASGLASLLVPIDRGFALTFGAGGGYGWRPAERDGPQVLASAALGWRPYNYFSVYAWAINLYVQGRAQLVDARAYEFTIGVELDLELLFVLPFMFLFELATASDPV